MSDRSRCGERRYRALLRAYPRAFRQEYAEGLHELFEYRRDRRLRAAGRLGLRFWSDIVRDVATSAWREWRYPLGPRRKNVHATGGDGMMGWYDDLAHAGRRLARSPGFSSTALVILVLGIGVNTTAFSLVNALLFQPPPFAEPERVVLILQDSDGGSPNSTSYPAYLDISRYDDVFSSVSAFTTSQAFLEQDDGLAPINVEYATASYLDVLGLAPSRGNWFGPLDDDPAGQPFAVLTHKMWTERLGSDAAALGSTIRIGGSAVTVVGVGPEEFNGGSGPAAIDLWLSISAMRPTGGRAASLERRQDHPFRVRGRLASGVSVDQATLAMDRLATELAATYPELNAERGISVLPVLTNRITPEVDADMVPVAALTMAVVTLVLLIGTLNLANLLLVRSAVRARELAVRLALGAGRARLVRVVFSEAAVLAAVGGLGGLAVAWLAAGFLSKPRFDLGLPIVLDVRLDARVLAFAAAISIITAFLFGLLPAVRATSRQVSSSLRDEATVTIGARRRFGLTGVLVASQVAVSLLLLAVAGVFIESLTRAQRADPGFAWENTAYVRLSLQPLGVSGDAARLLYSELQERLVALPEVGRVTTAIQLPATVFGTTTLLLGAAVGGVDAPTEIPWNAVSGNFFDVMEVGLLHGRTFDDRDESGPGVAIASATMARTYWGRTDIVGEVYRSEAQPEEPVEIVGVVEDVPVRALGEEPAPTLYWLSSAPGQGSILFEVAGTMDGAIAAARSTIAAVDDRILILGSSSMRDHLGGTLERQRLAGTLLGALGGLALSLAILGVYGVVSFAVSRRRHEVGIRLALGASRDSVVRLFVRDVAGVVIAGGVVGLGLSISVGRLVAQFFTGSAGTPIVTGGVALLLIATALAATVIPALRAARTDPTDALRQE